ncbi:teicoplanin resistance protein VanZ [Intestinibaculum porci]|uniref:Teicoplanin resistance protein VanZ n=1 Tax=Intestinibaculum porci TaxID=2487118 RepID=A0A3G9JSN3_9FIRM|nr:VanZ family protein [Intestinibaculum porci]BBH25854.1 teicoplanin resistance protein VanZ [Intestinibaculum porci]
MKKEKVLRDNSHRWLLLARFCLIVLILVWMYVIFRFSAQNGTNSHEASDHVVDLLQRIVYVMTGKDVSVILATGSYRMYIEFAVRKCAHMFIYFVLSINVMLLLFTYKRMPMLKRMFISLLVCFLYACTDEFHQRFSAGRGASFRDVLIDTSGAAFGLIAALIIFCVIFTIYTTHQQRKIAKYNASLQ